MTDNTTHFGYQEVDTQKKQGLVNAVFSSVADSYDLMNDLMSMGIHRLWKRHFVATSGIRAGDQVLDLAGGTGDITKLLLPVVGESGHVIVGDINEEMLKVGQQRLIDAGFFGRFEIQAMNAEKLPFDDNHFDAITMAFGLRNVTHKAHALTEMHRVLKPGGKALVLEFSNVSNALLKKIYDTYSFSLLPKVGELVAGDKDSYQYLVESIRKHPDQNTLLQMFETAGLEMCSFQNLSGGIVAIHKGYKL